jgi:hypothetical protein
VNINEFFKQMSCTPDECRELRLYLLFLRFKAMHDFLLR